MIGIIAAMDSEVRDIKSVMEDGIKIHHGGMTFFKGKLHQKEVIAVKSGVGKVNAAMCTQILIDIFKVSILIHVGVAGAVHPDLEIGDIVISEDSCQYDMDARAFGHPRGEIPNMDITFFKADPALIKLAETAAQELNVNYRVGRVMTADLGVDSNKLKEELREEFGGLCVEMEGAAVGQVAMLNQVPYLVIRSMSDKADSNLTDDYRENLEASIKNGVAMVLNMIQGVA
ncbi:MAG: 5'-methylthioadenosine/adenosylhomocysteine nucleosidase [Acetobacterium sp.]|uniref:5'-methylthioadenosine/adenosylhomocysteine nucleosidase n=1 Tax=Acetobacterium sp. TaxID=1872094 RepID=UPI003242616D